VPGAGKTLLAVSPAAITLADSVTLPPSTSRPGRGRSRRPRRPPCRWRHRPRGRHLSTMRP